MATLLGKAAVALALVIPSAATDGPGPCVVLHCSLQLAECLADTVCRTWSNCNTKCPQGDLKCQMRCADLYKPTDSTSAKINSFSECVISDNHCVPQGKTTCQVPDNAKKLSSAFDLGLLTGTWYITKGWNELFDCFDCQKHLFTLETAPVPRLVGDLKYSVKEDLACHYPDCSYLQREVHQSFVQDPANQGHLENYNNSKEELHYSDDWYVLAARENSYSLIYYCGCNDATCGYSGAVLYTRAPTFAALPASDVADIKAAVAAAKVPGFDFDGFCSPDNSACSKEEALVQV